jgi:hypothetical protein
MLTKIFRPTLDTVISNIRQKWEISTGILGVFAIFINFAATRDIGILIGLICVLTFYLNFKNFRQNNIQDKNIKNVQDVPDETTFIDRKDIAEKIVNTIFENKDDRVHILVGTSGSGKSVLISEFFPAQYQNHFKSGTICKQIIIKSYEDIDHDINIKMVDMGLIESHQHAAVRDAIRNIKDNQRIFFIFDQFESIFMLNHSNAIRQLKIICELFSTIKEINSKEKMIFCLIVMRKEWYFNLKFFGEIIPHIKNTFVLEGFNIKDDKLKEEIKSKLYKYTKDDKLTEIIIENCSQINTNEGFYVTSYDELIQKSLLGENDQTEVLLPIELMTVAESVFILKRSSDKEETTFIFEGKDKAIRRFFDYYLMSFKDKYDAMQVLYALSVSPKERRMLSLKEISHITNIPIDRVDNVLTYFLGKGETQESKERKPLLIQSENKEKVDWKHDFFAERCSEISGSMLDPVDRDNINYFWFNRNQKHSETKMSFADQNIVNTKAQKLGSTLFIISFLFLLMRTFYPLLVKIIPFNFLWTKYSVPLFSFPNVNWINNIDISFLPISISLTLWSWYITTAYRRLFSILQEPPKSFAARCSKFVAWWSLICVILTIFFPLLWVFFTGVGGLIAGLKYQQMTKSDIAGISTFEETFMKRLYKETKINSIVMMIIGLFYSLLFPQFNNNEVHSTIWYIGIILTAIFLVIMVYFALLSIREHTNTNRIPSYLGVYNRYRF